MRKLTEDDVRAIRKSMAQGHILAKRFGVHRFTILTIRQGRTWTHISPKVGRPWVKSIGWQKNASPERLGEA